MGEELHLFLKPTPAQVEQGLLVSQNLLQLRISF
jgi:hypothetical protein